MEENVRHNIMLLQVEKDVRYDVQSNSALPELTNPYLANDDNSVPSSLDMFALNEEGQILPTKEKTDILVLGRSPQAYYWT